jgi:hypothetical protein
MKTQVGITKFFEWVYVLFGKHGPVLDEEQNPRVFKLG